MIANRDQPLEGPAQILLEAKPGWRVLSASAVFRRAWPGATGLQTLWGLPQNAIDVLNISCRGALRCRVW